MFLGFWNFNIFNVLKTFCKNKAKQAGAELGQAQLKLELELSFAWSKIFCIKLINKNTAGYFDCH